MTALCQLLLAQANASAPRPGDWRFGWVTVGLLAGVSLAVILIAWLIARWVSARERRISNSPWRLFKDLTIAHGLNHRERQLLMRLATQFKLEQPTALFVEPAWWEPERLGPAWVRRLPEVEKLRKRLFAIR
jgi:hypothetical protein